MRTFNQWVPGSSPGGRTIFLSNYKGFAVFVLRPCWGFTLITHRGLHVTRFSVSVCSFLRIDRWYDRHRFYRHLEIFAFLINMCRRHMTKAFASQIACASRALNHGCRDATSPFSWFLQTAKKSIAVMNQHRIQNSVFAEGILRGQALEY